MEQPQQQQAPQRPPGSESPDWLARLPLPDMPDLAGDDWLQDFAPAPLAAAAPYSHAEAGAVQLVKPEPVEDEEATAGRHTRKRVRPAADADDTAFDSDAEDDTEPRTGCRRGNARRKGAAAKEQKKLNEKARRQRENDFIMQLAKLLDPARAGRADKLSTLADAVKEITRLRTDTAALQRLNKVLEERVADLKARQQYAPDMVPQLPAPPMVFMQQLQQMQAAAQQLQASQPQPHPQQQQTQSQAQQPRPVVPQPQQSQQQPQQLPQMQLPMQPQMPQPGLAGGMVALPAAAFQHMLAAHTQRMQEAAKMMVTGDLPASMQQPAPQQPLAAFKAPGSGEVLSSAAVLYMNPSDLDVSADASKRPVAA